MAVSQTPHRLYLLIDEYDNFANEVLMTGQKQGYYEALLYGEGLLKTVFKAVKAAAGGQGLDRVFITGVSPVALSDMTSGYNVGENIYLELAFNDLCGFTEAEIAAVLARMAAEGGRGRPPRRWTPCARSTTAIGSAKKAREGLYNPTLSLYFLKYPANPGRVSRAVTGRESGDGSQQAGVYLPPAPRRRTVD